jgi:hypothetical protein
VTSTNPKSSFLRGKENLANPYPIKRHEKSCIRLIKRDMKKVFINAVGYCMD